MSNTRERITCGRKTLIFLLLILPGISSAFSSKDSLRNSGFRKVRWHENILAGHKPGFTFPVSVNLPFGQDDPMDDISTYEDNLGEDSNYYLSGGMIFSFKNQMGRGLGLGVSFDYFPKKNFCSHVPHGIAFSRSFMARHKRP